LCTKERCNDRTPKPILTEKKGSVSLGVSRNRLK
jgi:hypothetical protein